LQTTLSHRSETGALGGRRQAAAKEQKKQCGLQDDQNLIPCAGSAPRCGSCAAPPPRDTAARSACGCTPTRRSDLAGCAGSWASSARCELNARSHHARETTQPTGSSHEPMHTSPARTCGLVQRRPSAAGQQRREAALLNGPLDGLVRRRYLRTHRVVNLCSCAGTQALPECFPTRGSRGSSGSAEAMLDVRREPGYDVRAHQLRVECGVERGFPPHHASLRQVQKGGSPPTTPQPHRSARRPAKKP